MMLTEREGMQLLALLLCAAGMMLLCGHGRADEIRAAPADAFAEIARNERTNHYLSAFDRAVEAALKTLDPDTGLIRIRGLMKPDQFDWSVAKLEPHQRKRYITPQYSKFYTLGRQSASCIGLLGEAYTLPMSRFHRRPELLEAVTKGLAAFSAHQDPGGEWVFCPIRFCTVYGSHEMAWRLEPLLRAYACVKSDLKPDERERYRKMLTRAADFLLHTPCRDRCNRGIVWAGVMALAYAMIGKQEYLDAAREQWARVAPSVFREDGQVLEGPGPDHGYSTVSIRYAFLYRIMSGDACADDALARALKWALRLYDANGVPFVGMSTRSSFATGDRLEAYLAPLEWAAPREPLFDRLAGDYLDYLEARSMDLASPHGGAYALRAALYHRSRADLRRAQVPDYLQAYEADVSIYAAARRQYQTVINLRSREPRNGLQMWTYLRERPVVCPTRKLASGTETWGFGSWYADVRGSEGYRVWHSDLDALAAERSGHYEFYVFSPVCTLVLYSGPHTLRKTRWVLSKKEVAKPVLRPGSVGFAQQCSALYHDGSPPMVRDQDDAYILEFEHDAPFDWYAFSGPPFHKRDLCLPVVGLSAMGFSDSTGAYLVLANPSRSAWSGKVEITWPEPRTMDLALGGMEVKVIALSPGT